jgi:hypothetical protein
VKKIKNVDISKVLTQKTYLATYDIICKMYKLNVIKHIKFQIVTCSCVLNHIKQIYNYLAGDLKHN